MLSICTTATVVAVMCKYCDMNQVSDSFFHKVKVNILNAVLFPVSGCTCYRTLSDTDKANNHVPGTNQALLFITRKILHLCLGTGRIWLAKCNMHITQNEPTLLVSHYQVPVISSNQQVSLTTQYISIKPHGVTSQKSSLHSALAVSLLRFCVTTP
jgi:hypothetical protein